MWNFYVWKIKYGYTYRIYLTSVNHIWHDISSPYPPVYKGQTHCDLQSRKEGREHCTIFFESLMFYISHVCVSSFSHTRSLGTTFCSSLRHFSFSYDWAVYTLVACVILHTHQDVISSRCSPFLLKCKTLYPVYITCWLLRGISSEVRKTWYIDKSWYTCDVCRKCNVNIIKCISTIYFYVISMTKVQ